MEFYTKALQSLIAEFERLPGIGRKTAERLAYHVLRQPVPEAMGLANAIREVKRTVRYCKVCYHLTEQEVCEICADDTRDRSTICVVEQPKDLHSIEGSASYRGLYHVLLGAVAPLDGVTPADLTVDALIERARGSEVREVILATNPNFEGEGTALFVGERLKVVGDVKVTRLARGMPSGSQLEHVSRTVVSDALEGRRELQE
jgi:recombination protein RecR